MSRISSGTDARWMREALRLAARARGRTAPNPLVGAVVVRQGRRISSGIHTRAGAPHAEAIALDRAGAAVRRATLYVTLEPCAHWGRTPPCVEQVLAAGLARIVVGMKDPDRRTAGRSLRRLRRAGLEVIVGVEEQAARQLNRGYLSRVERGRPFTHLKLAQSLDGRIATRTGESRWLSCERSRAYVHRLRREVDAVVVGSGTVLSDDPQLTARGAGRVVHQPVRIVVDSQLRTRPEARLIRAGRPEDAWLLTTRGAGPRRKRRLERAGARVIEVASRGGHIDLAAGWRKLCALGMNELLIEGGGGLAAALLRAGLVDRLHLILAPLLIGGDGRPVLESLGVKRLREALVPRRFHVRRLGQDLLWTGEW